MFGHTELLTWEEPFTEMLKVQQVNCNHCFPQRNLRNGEREHSEHHVSKDPGPPLLIQLRDSGPSLLASWALRHGARQVNSLFFNGLMFKGLVSENELSNGFLQGYP